NGLPKITTPITLNGNGSTIARSAAQGTPDMRLFFVSAGGILSLNSVTLANGLELNGGGILNDGGTINITNSTITNNLTTGYDGGGIYNNSGTLTISSSTFTGNSAYF